MAARFWVTGGTGNWNSTTNWASTSGGASGASVPGSADTAALDANSGSGTVTLDISPTIQTLTCTGFTGTLAYGTNTITLNSTGTIFTGSTTMTVTGTPLIICTNSSATSRTIAPTAVTEANSISFRITAGTGAFNCSAGAIRDIDFTDGTNPTGYGGQIATFAVTIYGNFKASTNMTASSSANTFTFAATSGTKTINTAGVTFDRPFTFNGVGGTWQLQAALTSGATRTCTLTNGTLDLNGFTLTSGTFASSNSNTRTLAFGSTGKIVLNAATGTILSGTTSTGITVTGTNRLIQVAYAGGGTVDRNVVMWSLPEAQAIDVEVINGSTSPIIIQGVTGGYKNLTFTSFAGAFSFANTIRIFGNFYLNSGMTTLAGTTATFAATSGTKTITTNGVVINSTLNFNGLGGTFELQDNLTLGSTNIADLNGGTLSLLSRTLTAGIFTSSGTGVREMAFGTGKIVLTGTNVLVFGTSTATNLTVSGTRRVELTGVGVAGETRSLQAGNVATGGGSAANAMDIYITAGADIIAPGTGARAYRTLDFTGFSGQTVAGAAPQIYGDLVLSSTMTVPSGNNEWTFAATDARTITTNGVTMDTGIIFDGVGGTWSFADALTQGSTRPVTFINGTVKLKSGTTNTIGSLVTSGTNQKFLQSTTAGSQATLSDSSGVNNVSYVTVKDSNATGGARFQAFTSNNNVNAGNNTGWYFINTVSFLSFF